MNYQPAYNQTPVPAGLAQYQQQLQQHQQIRRDGSQQSFQAQQQLPQQLHNNIPHYAQSQPYPYPQHSGAAGPDKLTAWSTAGAMLPPGLDHRMAINQPYTNSPYSQIPATTNTVTSQRQEQRTPLPQQQVLQLQQQQLQHQQPPPPPPRPREGHHSGSPPAANFVQSTHNISTPQQQAAMAAPPPPQPQVPTQPGIQGQNAHQKQVLQPPLSPSSAKREKERVKLLLEINRDLLQEVVNLQAQGRAGVPGLGASPSGQQAKEDDKDNEQSQKKHPSKEYVECMRRLQANLSYLAAVADRVYKPAKDIPPSPALMEAPANSPALEELYSTLRDLFPHAKTQNAPTPGLSQKGVSDVAVTQLKTVQSAT